MDILSICRSQEGYREHADRWTQYGAWLDQQAGTHEYARADWCGAFLLWAIAQGGPAWTAAAGGLNKDFAEVQVWLDWMAAHGRTSRSPAPRRLVWYDWAGTPRGANHIGLVDHYTATHIWAWEGNHNNQVELVERPRDGQIMAYGEWWSHIPPPAPARAVVGNAWLLGA